MFIAAVAATFVLYSHMLSKTKARTLQNPANMRYIQDEREKKNGRKMEREMK